MKTRYSPIKFAMKNVAFSTINGLSLLTMPIKSHENEPIINAKYPILDIPNATRKAPAMLATVPTQEIILFMYVFYHHFTQVYIYCLGENTY